MKEYTIIANIKLSNLSKKPPCPGRKLLEFFKLLLRLKIDSIISPIKLDEIIIIINKILSKLTLILNSIKKSKLHINEIVAPPINPSKVLFGLIFFSNFNLPIYIPTKYENTSKVIIIKIIKLKFKYKFLSNSILNNEIKEITI
tara:strand:- start:81 stop:512 length:432 start_codon:yes stop_codon:yes gene_type:complete